MVAYEHYGRAFYQHAARRIRYISEQGRHLALSNLIYYSNRRHVEVENYNSSELTYYWYPIMYKGPMTSGVIGDRYGGRDVPMPLQERVDDFPLELGDFTVATHRNSDFTRTIYEQNWRQIWDLYKTQGAAAALGQMQQLIISALAAYHNMPVGTVVLVPRTMDDDTLSTSVDECVPEIATLSPGTSDSSPSSLLGIVDNTPHAQMTQHSSADTTISTNLSSINNYVNDNDEASTLQTNLCGVVVASPSLHQQCSVVCDIKNDAIDNMDDYDDDMYYPTQAERKWVCRQRRQRVHKAGANKHTTIPASSVYLLPVTKSSSSTTSSSPTPVQNNKVTKKRKRQQQYKSRLVVSAQHGSNDPQKSLLSVGSNHTAMIPAEFTMPEQIHVQQTEPGNDDIFVRPAKKIKLDPMESSVDAAATPAHTGTDGVLITNGDQNSLTDDPSLSVLDSLLLANDWSSCDDEELIFAIPNSIMHPQKHDELVADQASEELFVLSEHNDVNGHEMTLMREIVSSNLMIGNDDSLHIKQSEGIFNCGDLCVDHDTRLHDGRLYISHVELVHRDTTTDRNEQCCSSISPEVDLTECYLN